MSIRLLTGENSYQAFTRLQKLKINDSIVIDAEDAQTNDISQAVQGQSLFSTVDKTQVIIKYLFSDKKSIELIKDRLEGLAKDDSIDLIIYDPQADKRTKLYKDLLKIKAVEEFKNLNEFALLKWVQEAAEFDIKPNIAKKLVDNTGIDQWRLHNELQKLKMYEGEVTIELVDSLVDKTVESSIFDMLDMLAKSDADAATAELDSLLDQGAEPIYISSMLAWQFDNVLKVYLYRNDPEQELTSNYKISPYVIRKIRPLANKMSRTKLKKIFEELVDLEYTLKNRNVDKKLTIKVALSKVGQIISS